MPTPAASDRVRLIIYLKRLGSVTQDDVLKWCDTYAELLLALPVAQKNLLEYGMIQPIQEIDGNLKSFGYVKLTRADSVALFDAESFEKIQEVFEDETYVKAIKPLERKIFDIDNAVAIPVTIKKFVINK